MLADSWQLGIRPMHTNPMRVRPMPGSHAVVSWDFEGAAAVLTWDLTILRVGFHPHLHGTLSSYLSLTARACMGLKIILMFHRKTRIASHSLTILHGWGEDGEERGGSKLTRL